MIKRLLKTTIAIILVLFAMSKITRVRAEAPQLPVEEAIQNLHKSEYSKEDIITLIGIYAEKYGVSEYEMRQTVFHESHYDRYDIGDDGNSYGIAQIHLPSHRGITIEQAQDPHFALDFMAKNFKAGQARMWTGYRLCINNETIIYRGKQLHCTPLTD